MKSNKNLQAELDIKSRELQKNRLDKNMVKLSKKATAKDDVLTSGKTQKDNDYNKFYEDLVEEVKQDFKQRQEERVGLERQWELNINYVSGNQYCEIAGNGEILEEEKYYYWQSRNVYNHIAPIIDTRISRLTRNRPIMSVRAVGDEEADIKSAKLSSAILNSTYSRIELFNTIQKATVWSEVCGTAIYKIIWNGEKGKLIGSQDESSVYEGDIDVIALSPFEIFPDSIYHENLENCKSIIHARSMHVDDVLQNYGVSIKGEKVNVLTLCDNGLSHSYDSGKIINGEMRNHCLVIERYERPSVNFPNGRVVTVAGNKLLYIGELPYSNGIEARRDFPFVKQDALYQAGSFFGVSMIERIIPLQRSYNAIKNRKQEFLNRLSMGVVAVEDGSVDADELLDEGLSPGKVIVYRQGSKPPQMMPTNNIPLDLSYEEKRLEEEFVMISGVSEFSRSSTVAGSLTSGTALQLLIEQDDSRMASSLDNIRRAVKMIGKHIIRLFKQFAKQTRMMRIAGENSKVSLYYFNDSDLTSDDVVFDTESELSYTPAQKRTAVYELLKTGLLTDKNGQIAERVKNKILEILGFGSIDNVRDLEALHINRAMCENIDVKNNPIAIEDYDDHEIHIAEHTRFMLSADSKAIRDSEDLKSKMTEHIASHKNAIEQKLLKTNMINQVNKGENL